MLQRYLGYQIIPLHVPGVRGEAVPVYGFVVFQAAKDFSGVSVFGTNKPSGGIHQQFICKGIDLGIRVIDGRVHLIR